MPLPQGGYVALSTRGPTAIRVRIHAEWHGPFDSPMIGPNLDDMPFLKVSGENGTGIATDVGSVVVSKQGGIILRAKGGKVLTESEPISVDHPIITFSTAGAKLYGRGASPLDAGQLNPPPGTVVHPMVVNRATYAPYYYSTDGYAALGAVNETHKYKLPVTYLENTTSITWHAWVLRGAFELYLMPAATLAEGTQAYYALTGAPQVPPRYAFGFMASRWGWKNKEYIEETVAKFRNGGFPLDAIICDFEWFTNESDYLFPPQGKTWYRDFGYNPAALPAPAQQLPYWRDKLHVHFGGIRKPRLGNTDLLHMAHKKGWILPGGEVGGRYPPRPEKSYAWGRGLNFSNPEVRDWYGSSSAHLLKDGVEFWWNDEGETDYFTFHWWNVAQSDQLRLMNPTKRFYSLNRAWSPGMARLGATVWTGDIDPSWEDLRGTPGMMLNWVLAGAPYVACDIGGFVKQTQADLLARWMQLGAFLPTMRVHSVNWATPHWPWLWGPAAANTIRQALELRYRLLPYHYSLAHKMYDAAIAPKDTLPFLWMRPLVMEFPDDPVAASTMAEWMDGDILVAPVVRQDSQREVYLPKGWWYQHETSHIIYGPAHIGGTATPEEIPRYVRCGTVLPMGNVVQFSDALPSGPLQVQVYGGADGSFELVEDDGLSRAYEAGNVRRLRLRWNDTASTLHWTVLGDLEVGGPQRFRELRVTLFDKSGIRHSAPRKIGTEGSISLGGPKFV